MISTHDESHASPKKPHRSGSQPERLDRLEQPPSRAHPRRVKFLRPKSDGLQFSSWACERTKIKTKNRIRSSVSDDSAPKARHFCLAAGHTILVHPLRSCALFSGIHLGCSRISRPSVVVFHQLAHRRSNASGPPCSQGTFCASLRNLRI